MLTSILTKTKPPKNQKGSFGEQAAQRLQISRSTVDPHRVIYGRVRTSGTMIFAHTTDYLQHKNNYLHVVIALAGHECQEIEQIWIDEKPIALDVNGFATTVPYNTSPNSVRIKMHLGQADQTADTDLTAEVPIWTDKHRLQGITYIYARLYYTADVFTNGMPNISAIIKGKKLFDPRDSSTAWSANTALAIRDYCASTDYGLSCANFELDDDSFIAAANVCDETVTLGDATTQPRFTCNGIVDTSVAPIDILKNLSTAMAGAIPYVQGRFRCFAGAYNAPSITITASWLRGDIDIQARTPRASLFNAVKGQIVDPASNWQPMDFPPVVNTTYQAQDGGFQIFNDLELPFTINMVEAQRIGKIALEKSRQGIVVKAPCNWMAMQLSVWDTVMFDLDQVGWSGKIFRVTQWAPSPDGGFDLVLQEESSASYDWAGGEETTIDTAPDTNLPLPGFVEMPGNPVITEVQYVTTDGSGVKTKAVLNWTDAPDAFAATYSVFFKLATDTVYSPGPYVPNGTAAEIIDIAPGTYDFGVVAATRFGNTSAMAVTRKEMVGLTAPPADVSNFTLSAVANQAHMQWTQASDLDVRIGGTIKIKFSNKTTGATWSNAQDIAPEFSGIATTAVVPLRSGTYFAKFYDSVRNESVNAAEITTQVPDAIGMTAINTSTQDPAFSGNLVNMMVASSILKLDGSSLSGSYTFTEGGAGLSRLLLEDGVSTLLRTDGTSHFLLENSGTGVDYIDLGTSLHNRIVFNLDSLVVDESSLFDSADGDFDSREGLFDGTDRSNVHVTFWVQTTADNPAGTPTWSDWIQVNTVGEFVCRAYKRKINVESELASNNIHISGLQTVVYIAARDEIFNDQAIGIGGNTLTYGTPFITKPNFYLTVQGTVSGDTPNYTHVTSGGLYTGVTVQILNAGSGVARTIDLTARGS